MRSSGIISALLGVAIVATMTPKTDTQDLTVAGLLGGLTGNELVEAVTKKLVGLWRTGDIVLMDRVCSYQVKPTIRKFELYFKGTFWCPGWTPIRGQSLTRSNSNAVNDAVRDFVQQAMAKGVITEEAAREWLSQEKK
ncbi:anti-lipopolysaccharide factor-like [Palaemon carinicauda]|uniref:anti-lipopolysaccharide factor-like n=1 Tax=Palaemon carinicauda TaxID=392227 RepID=UPI0035B5C3A8